ncbi:hypothetical protein AVU43_gp02 [Ralstonia phage RSJ5]|uniref:Uncharacterized protein n=1 Tax=Ralstonia phage RSJ5 TaxID=1538364 RepID=A0A077KTC6_9CAUD|nr:hypothetical protein AVU43_gp02 [Ralstonia phage RSJ5]BAP34896.1 hypothetical protein [Ralstonia phage RSJ5]
MLHPAIYTEVVPATDKHGTQVVARDQHSRIAVAYPHELTTWEEIHGVAVQALLTKKGAATSSKWIPALFGAGVVWVCTATAPEKFHGADHEAS